MKTGGRGAAGTQARAPVLNAAAIVLFLLAVGPLGLALAARAGHPGAAFQLTVTVQHLWAFPGALQHRNSRCSVWQAWSLSPAAERELAVEAIQKTVRVERQDGPVALVRTPSGPYWIPRRDVVTIGEAIEEQQRDVYSGAGISVRPGDVVLDCGANIGAYTRHALERGARLVVAIEPAPESLACLRRNFDNEVRAGRVIIYPKGVWDKEGQLELKMGPTWASTASSLVLDRGGAGPKVPLTTIDRLVTELQLPRVDFIKMDIEGAEAEALAGASETVRRFHPRMAVSLEHRPSDPDTIPPLLHRLWPDYVSRCGPCTNVNGSIQPEVLFARAR